jgi:hypothetical protein
MKHFTWCLLLLCQYAFGQHIKDEDYKNISGNPYLFKDWNEGQVRFASGRVLTQFKLKFDCLKNMLLLQFDGSTFAAESKVQEFAIYLKGKKKDSLLFRKGFPTTDKTNEHTYFQVLFHDKVTLLRLFGRNIIEEKQLVNASDHPHRRLEDTEHYYLLQQGRLILLPASRAELPEKFTGKQEQIAQFIAQQQLKLHEAEDFVQVVKKYNELL